MSDADDKVDLNVLKAPLPRRNEDGLQQLRFQLLGFATALAVLVVLAPTWLVRDSGRSIIAIHSGLGMIRDSGPIGDVGNYLFFTYVVLALVALALPTTITAFVCAYAGLVDTIVIMLLKPGSESSDSSWTGAPVLAIGLWLVLAVVNHVGWYNNRA